MSSDAKLFVTGATGALGSLVIDALLETVSPERIVAGVRDTASDGAAMLHAMGVGVRIADYDRIDTLAAAFGDVDRLLLISGSEVGRRKAQHRNVIAAAQGAGVSLIAYTSILRASSTPLMLADEHRDTEAALSEAGIPHVLLRNGWYTEVYTWRLPLALKSGTFFGAAGEGRISAAARADYARAAAAVLLGEGQAGLIYELAGDTAFTLADLADVAGKVADRALSYQNLSPDGLLATALSAGTPQHFAKILSDTDAGVARGALFDDGLALSRLIGRPTTPFAETIRDFIGKQSEAALR